MRVCIHRGAAEIGGSCVELQAEGERLILDLGRPLWAGSDDEVPLPAVPGLRGGDDKSLLGVLLSHAHLDHYGLLARVPPGVPLYAGAATSRILSEAAFFGPAGLDRKWKGALRDRERLELGPFRVTPYLVDHSAFDAYAFLVEAEGRRLFYSGDLRAHGQLHGDAFERLLVDPPADVQTLLLEGTRVGRRGASAAGVRSEADLQDRCTQVFSQTGGIVLVAYSAQNIDRLLTLHRAVLRSRSTQRPRDLVIDPYVEAIAKATGNPAVPRAGHRAVRVYVPQSQRVKIKRARQFERVNAISRHRIFPEDLHAQRERLAMTFRGSMISELEDADCLEDAHLVWSLWPGYLETERMRRLVDWLDRRGIPLSVVHASGHATVEDLQRLAVALDPDRVIPIHTDHPELYVEHFANVELRRDGEWWRV